MKKPLLSITIATIPKRKLCLNELLSNLQEQIIKNNLEEDVEIIVFEDDCKLSLGEKKDKLYSKASGLYIVSLDDDDIVSCNYCEKICKAIRENPGVDQISFNHKYFYQERKKWVPINISINNKFYGSKWFFNSIFLKHAGFRKDTFSLSLETRKKKLIEFRSDSWVYFIMVLLFVVLNRFLSQIIRHTCHTVPIRSEIAKSISFGNKKDEDIKWAEELRESEAIKTEVKIDEPLYYYYHNLQTSSRGNAKEFMSDWKVVPIKKIKIHEIN